MVWDGLTDNEAAIKVGMTVTNIRLALKEPHVRVYYREALHVLRTRESARNIHTLAEVRDQKTNQMARVQAVKALEQLDDEVTTRRGSGFSAAPGLIINIINAPGVGLTRAIGVHEGESATISTAGVPSLGERHGDDDE